MDNFPQPLRSPQYKIVETKTNERCVIFSEKMIAKKATKKDFEDFCESILTCFIALEMDMINEIELPCPRFYTPLNPKIENSSFENYLKEHHFALCSLLNHIYIRAALAIIKMPYDDDFSFLEEIQNNQSDYFPNGVIASTFDDWIPVFANSIYTFISADISHLEKNPQFPQRCVRPQIRGLADFWEQLYHNPLVVYFK